MAAPTDPAVRSVRIAATLNERFAAVMRFGPRGPTSLDDFELRIGEAQQLYPEIWTHLDEACATLAGRGVITAAYDQVRAQEPKGSLGVTRVDVNPYSANLDYLKRAHFNHEGHRRAVQAVKALMDAMPEVDWKGLEREENAEIAAVGSLGPINSRSMVTWLAILGGAGVVAGAFWYLVIRTPPRDYAGERAARIADYTKTADEHPCKKSVVHALAQEIAWDGKPAETSSPGHLHLTPLPDMATEMGYVNRCVAAIADYKRALAVDPCDKVSLAGLEAMLDDRDGHVDAGFAAKNEYDAYCKDKP